MIGYYGYRGSGKTLSLTAHLWDEFRRDPDICVITNTPFSFPPHPKTGQSLLQHLFFTVDELEEFFLFAVSEKDKVLSRMTFVVIDEASVAMPSRFFSKIDPFILPFLAESRKFNVEIIFTTQHPSRVDLILRELTETWFHCQRVSFLGLIKKEEQDLSPSGQVIATHGQSWIIFRKKYFSMYDTTWIVGINPSLLPPKTKAQMKMLAFFENYDPSWRLQAPLASSKRGDLQEAGGGVMLGSGVTPSPSSGDSPA